MTDHNRFGLSRVIPSAIRRQVRQRCGFGCVRCGVALVDYEHFDPDFKDAAEHRAEGITLLCMQCNQKRRRGVLSAETVAAANSAPRCRSQGFASESFDFGTDSLEVVFAGVRMVDCNRLIEVNSVPILAVIPPEMAMQPYRLSGLFADETGDITLEIRDNIWSVDADNWDVECVGPRIFIRRGARDISLILRSEPPHRLVVEQLNMQFEGIRLRGTDKRLEQSFDGTNWNAWHGGNVRGCSVGISFRSR